MVWNRDYSLTQNCFSVNTLNGRVKLPYFTEGMTKYFNHTIYKFGTAKLVNKHGKYFCIFRLLTKWQSALMLRYVMLSALDRGINFVVATYDSKHKSDFVSGKSIKQKRARLFKLLQRTSNASDSIFKTKNQSLVGQRENRLDAGCKPSGIKGTH